MPRCFFVLEPNALSLKADDEDVFHVFRGRFLKLDLAAETVVNLRPSPGETLDSVRVWTCYT